MDISDELIKLGHKPDRITFLREKDGIRLYRTYSGYNSFVLKFFISESDRREIIYYDLLQACRIPTVRIYAKTERSILMEDLEQNKTLRLGQPQDLQDPRVARKLAVWYRKLHKAGPNMLAAHPGPWYAETDVITAPNLDLVAQRTGTAGADVWQLLMSRLDQLQELLRQLSNTVTYNDFYYTNLAVSRDGTTAIMFDYNRMGRGFAASDLRNVTASLGPEAGKAFLESYGPLDNTEQQADSVASVLVTLIFASHYETPPNWARDSLQKLYDGTLRYNAESLLT